MKSFLFRILSRREILMATGAFAFLSAAVFFHWGVNFAISMGQESAGLTLLNSLSLIKGIFLGTLFIFGLWFFAASYSFNKVVNALLESDLPGILVVDDEEDVREMIIDLLKEKKLRLLSAASAEEAIEILKREKVDLVVSDVYMDGKI
jgi:hypothetical protein